MRKLSVILLFLAVPLFAGSVSKEYDRTFDLNNDGRVEVSAINGRVNVESWDRSEVRVFADIEVKSSSRHKAKKFMEHVRINVKRSSDRISIEPDYPKRGSSGFLSALFGNSKPQVRINFTIQVPRSAEIKAKSVNGNVETNDINGAAELYTTNGQIKAFNMGGAVTSRTTNGSIHVEMDDWDSDQDISFHTTNGSIQVHLPHNINADVDVSTVNGSITTDFPIEGELGRKSIHGTINDGGPSIELRTVNGSVKLYEL